MFLLESRKEWRVEVIDLGFRFAIGTLVLITPKKLDSQTTVLLI